MLHEIDPLFLSGNANAVENEGTRANAETENNMPNANENVNAVVGDDVTANEIDIAPVKEGHDSESQVEVEVNGNINY